MFTIIFCKEIDYASIKIEIYKNHFHNYLTKIFFNTLAKLNCPNQFYNEK